MRTLWIAGLAIALLIGCGTPPVDPGPSKADKAKAEAAKRAKEKATAEKLASDASGLLKKAEGRAGALAKQVKDAGGDPKIADGILGTKQLAPAKAKLTEGQKLIKAKKHGDASGPLKEAFDLLTKALADAGLLAGSLGAKKDAMARKAEYDSQYGPAGLKPEAIDDARFAMRKGDRSLAKGAFGAAKEAYEDAGQSYKAAIAEAKPLLEKRRKEVLAQAAGMTGSPAKMCRFMALNRKFLAGVEGLDDLAKKSGLWRLKVTTTTPGATVVLRPISKTGGVDDSEANSLDLGKTPVDFGFVDSAVYQVVVRSNGQHVAFPIEFRKRVTDPASAPKIKMIAVPTPIPDGMTLVPVISGAAVQQKPGQDRDYWIDKLEMTNELFAKCRQELNLRPPLTWPGGKMPAGGEKLPVLGLLFPDALYFGLWAGKRMATDVEWHKAAGGQDNRQYPWGGSTFNKEGAVTSEAKSQDPKPVGGRPAGASPYALQDVSGNAGEMVWPTEAADVGKLLLKGGSFARPAAEATISAKRVLQRNNIVNDCGQRYIKNLLTSKTGAPITIDQALADTNPGVVIEALCRLSKSNDKAAWEKIFAKSTDANEMIRLAAGFYAIQGEESFIRPLLAAKLEDADTKIRQAAVNALLPHLRPALADLLYPVVSDTDLNIRKSVLVVLATKPTAAHLPALVKATKDADPAVRGNAIAAISWIKSPEAITALKGLLTNPDAQTKHMAAISLIRLGVKDVATQVVKQLITQVNNQMRNQMLQRIALVGADEVVKAAAPLLNDPQQGPKTLAIQLIGLMGGVEYTDQFIGFLQDRQLQQATIFALATLKTDKASAAVVGLLGQQNLPQNLRSVLANLMISQRYAKVVPQLINLVNRAGIPDQEKLNYLIGMANIGGTEAQQFLHALLSGQNPLRRNLAAWQAYAMSGHSQAIPTITRVRSSQPPTATADQKVMWASVLGMAGDKSVKAELRKVLDEGQLWNRMLQFASRGLATLHTEAELLALLKSSNLTGQMAGTTALLRLSVKAPDDKTLGEILLNLLPQAQLQLLTAISQREIVGLIPAVRKVIDTADRRLNIFPQAIRTLQALLVAQRRKAKGG